MVNVILVLETHILETGQEAGTIGAAKIQKLCRVTGRARLGAWVGQARHQARQGGVDVRQVGAT